MNYIREKRRPYETVLSRKSNYYICQHFVDSVIDIILA